jgi:hypothetical protein
MIRFSSAFVLLVAFVVVCCACFAPAADRPPIELPVSQEHSNYAHGSCAYAAAEDLLSLQGRDDLARYVRSHYAGGVELHPSKQHPSLVALAESLELDYDFVEGVAGQPVDEHWLQRATDLGLAAVIQWTEPNRQGRMIGGDHALTFLGFSEDGSAWILDNNSPGIYWQLSRDEFLSAWARSGGNAFTFVLRPKE